MEAVREFLPFQDADRVAAAPVRRPGVDDALAVLQDLGSTAVQDAAGWGFAAASDFAGRLEDASRALEFLQVVAAGAVDRTRKQAASAAAAAASPGGGAGAWTTGWRESPGGWVTGAASEPGSPAGIIAAVAAESAGPTAAAGPVAVVDASAAAAVDDGYRKTEDFLRDRLRIGASDARRRLTLAKTLLPREGLTGHPTPPVHEELAAAVAAGTIGSRSAAVITTALDRVRHLCDPESAGRMEHALTRTAAEHDPDFLARVARGWTEALDQDGTEPSEELLRQRQGAFIRPPRHGLQHLEIFATTDQFEHLITVMNAATNPRTTPAADAGAGGGADDGSAGGPGEDPALPVLDLRSRPQKLLDGLVGASKVALAAGGLPATGGLRPQIMATIDYQDLLTRLQDTTGTSAGAGQGTGAGTGALLFTGPVTAATIRKIACDADIIPVLLGGEGRILDVGRASRLFPPHIRKALTARDGGCTFPACTIPAPWCEAHHITYWSRGGPTSTENGTLLCSHHHHLIHKENWTIQMRSGVPWFIPPPHLDPSQHPRRNHYFRPTDHAQTG